MLDESIVWEQIVDSNRPKRWLKFANRLAKGKINRAYPHLADLGPHRQGFTLVELLLAVAVMVLLVSAVVFSFSTVAAGSQLDEGALQFENLVRLARAHASNTGRRVQLAFQEEVTPEAAVVGRARVLWEADPIGDPGHFETLWEVGPVLSNVNEFIAIDSSRRSGTDEASLSGGEPRPDWTDAGAEAPPWLTPVTFYADGSADSAEIVLVSRDADDNRRVVLHIEGITGALRRQASVDDSALSTAGEGQVPSSETGDQAR